jgi:hypothetical protein
MPAWEYATLSFVPTKEWRVGRKWVRELQPSGKMPSQERRVIVAVFESREWSGELGAEAAVQEAAYLNRVGAKGWEAFAKVIADNQLVYSLKRATA